MVGMENYNTADYPDRIGLMVLPWASLFPGGLIPLRIFEERYRHMLRDALAGHRMFGIAHATGDQEEEIERIASIGVVRACVKNDDGTSSLILQGLARVVLSNESFDPYPAADIAVLQEPDDSSREITRLRKTIQKHLLENLNGKERLPDGFADHLVSITSDSAFADLLASTAIVDPIKRRVLFEEMDVTLRMQMLLDSLQADESMEETEEP
jgi:Lon protease-like protein